MKKEDLKNIIKDAAVKSISAFFDTKLKSKKEANFQILDLVMPKERKIRSIVGGLETSLGTTLWEPLAKEIAAGNGFVVKQANLEAPANFPAALSNTLQNIVQARQQNNGQYNGVSSHSAIKAVCQQYINSPIGSFIKAPTGSGVDIWLQKNGMDYFFDTKTVQPSVGAYDKFLTQILNWYAYYYSKHPTGNAEAKIVFPYNPYGANDFWSKTIDGGKPIERNTEAWVENEFWDFLSGEQNTFLLIKESFSEIFTEGTLETSLDTIFDRHKEDLFVEPNNPISEVESD